MLKWFTAWKKFHHTAHKDLPKEIIRSLSQAFMEVIRSKSGALKELIRRLSGRKSVRSCGENVDICFTSSASSSWSLWCKNLCISFTAWNWTRRLSLVWANLHFFKWQFWKFHAIIDILDRHFINSHDTLNLYDQTKLHFHSLSVWSGANFALLISGNLLANLGGAMQ